MMKVKLGDVCEIVSGTTPKSNCPEYWNGELNWITPAELNDDIVVVNESQRKITTKAVIDSNLRSFSAGTVLLSSRAPIGKVAIAGKEMYCNQGFKNLICSDFIYNKYLFYFLKSKVAYLNSLGRGATFKEISKTIVENIQINLPKKEEQYKIVHILDKLNELIFLRQQQLKKFDELVKSRFIEMFGDPITNSYNLPIVPLGELSELITKGASPSWQGFSYTDDRTQTLFITSENVREGYIDLSFPKYIEDGFNDKQKRSVIHKGDFLINIVGASIGRAAQFNLDCKANMNQAAALVRINDKRIKDNYLLIYLNSEKAQRMYDLMKSDTGRANLSLKDISDLSILLPPIAQQEKFEKFFMQTDKSKLEIQKSLDKLEILKKSLMQQYFD